MTANQRVHDKGAIISANASINLVQRITVPHMLKYCTPENEIAAARLNVFLRKRVTGWAYKPVGIHHLYPILVWQDLRKVTLPCVPIKPRFA